MQDPILETLNFSLKADLNVDEKPGHSLSSNPYGLNECEGGNRPLAIIKSHLVLDLNQPIQCVFPGCNFISDPIIELKKIKESNLLEHFLRDHHFVLDKVEEIAYVKRYLNYWREKFLTGKLLDYCVSIVMDRPLIHEHSKQEIYEKQFTDGNLVEKHEFQKLKEENKFLMLTPLLPEDRALRDRLWSERLEQILEINRLEREDIQFSKQCLFCKEMCVGNRSLLFQHMAESHGFHIGQADNVVFVNEFIDSLNDTLNRNICLYCTKTFKDKAVLREHMRKKQHRRINGSNGEYDKFYVINYLEPGKTWKVLEEEDQEDERREEEWVEARNLDTSIVCLMCSEQRCQFDLLLNHMKEEHSFDFLQATAGYDFYQKVKIVNFLRRTFYQNVCFLCDKKFFERTSLVMHINEHLRNNKGNVYFDPKLWERPEFFFPTYENDQFLIMLDQEPEGSSMETEDQSTVVIPEDIPVLTSSDFLAQELKF